MPGPEPDWGEPEQAGGRLCPTGNVTGGPGWPTTGGSKSQARVLQKLCELKLLWPHLSGAFFPRRRLGTRAEPGLLLPPVALTHTPTPRAIPGVASWSSRLCASPRSTSVSDSASPCCLELTVGALEGSWPDVAILAFLEPRVQARPVLKGLKPSCWDLRGL